MSGLNLRKVRKSFGDVHVTKNVDLDINPGEFVVFVGPSGCGKSTLLRLIAGLETTTSGSISIGGKDVTDAQPADRGIAMVFQSYALYPHMTVRENMGFGLKMNGFSSDHINDRVSRAAEILHLNDYLDRKPKALSGGQRQRVAIGRAIVREPEVFLFDEPLSNLDAELRVKMRLEIAKLHKDLGATMIYVTHDQVEAMTLADKIVVLRAGIIEQYGSPIELYEDPDNIFVAGFIGSPKMNFFEAEISSLNEGSVAVTLKEYAGTTVNMSVKDSSLKKGQSVIVGIRPEHFDPHGEVNLSTKIDVIENLGGTAYAYARSDETDALTIELKEESDIEEGKEVTVRFNAERAFLFDAVSEKRIR